MTRRGRLPAWCALLMGTAFSVSLAAASGEYRVSYENGIRAIDQSDWRRAIEALRSAVAENSLEGDRVLIYGMRFKPYLPHYYLGLTYFRTGNCGAAIRAWAESDRQGAIRQTAEYANLVKLREQCAHATMPEPDPSQIRSTVGVLVVDALPWGRVERVEDASGKNWITEPEYTPVSLSIPAGTYSVTVTDAAPSGGKLVLSVDVPGGRTAHSVARFAPVDPDGYFKSQGWRR